MCNLRILRIAKLAVLGLTIAGCASSTASIEQQWRSPEAQRGQLQNVVTLFASQNSVLQRSGETKLAQQLGSQGIRATPGYLILSAEDRQDRPRTIAKLRAAGYDGVVAMRVVSQDTQLAYLPGGYNTWGMPEVGTVIPETVVRIQTEAYSLDHDKRIWSALSKSVAPDGIRELIDDVTQVVTRALGQQGLLAAQAA